MAQKNRSTRKLGSLILHFIKQLTIESGVWLGNLRIILAGGGNLKDPILKSSNAQERGWGCWSFELIDAETEISRKVKCSLRVTLWNKFSGFTHSGLVIGFKLATYSLAVWCWLPSSWSITQCTEMWKFNIYNNAESFVNRAFLK